VGGADHLASDGRRRLHSALDLAGARRARTSNARQETASDASDHEPLPARRRRSRPLDIYLAVDEDAHASIAFVALAVVALLGFTMFAIWLRRKKGRGGAASAMTPKTPPEQHFPRIDRRLHGVLAATTLVFVQRTAIGVGGS
jgi:hypothetical protein